MPRGRRVAQDATALVVPELVLGVDPGDTLGLGLVDRATGLVVRSRTVTGLADRLDGDLMGVLEDVLGSAQVRWCAAVERPYNRRGPTYVYRRMLALLPHLARTRAARLGLRYRAPSLLRVYPNTWRAGLGLPMKPREKCKTAAVLWAVNHGCPSPETADEAEACAVGAWVRTQPRLRWAVA